MRRKVWETWEAEAAQRLGLERTISSGNRWHDTGDAVSRGLSDRFPLWADAKCTEAKSFTLKSDELRYYTELAQGLGKHMVLPVRFARPVGRPEDYVVMTMEDLETLLALARTA